MKRRVHYTAHASSIPPCPDFPSFCKFFPNIKLRERLYPPADINGRFMRKEAETA